VQLRRAHQSFPIRSFVPALVDTLEDGDGTVRECAKQSVVEIFTGPGVTDAARTDLKKEMTKKNVRKAIVDSLLPKLLAGSGRNTPLKDGFNATEETVSTPTAAPTRRPLAGRSVSQPVASQQEFPSRSGDATATESELKPVYVS